jgi:hypothetical protein
MQTTQKHINFNQPTLGMVGTICPFYNGEQGFGLFEKRNVSMS